MDPNSPRVSVVLATYNAAPHLRGCINSILGQTFADFELIVVDDGSTDGTLALLDAYDDDRIHVINRSDSPNSIPGSVNDGIRAASGEYIARHDADDRSHPERLAKQVEFLDAHPDVALLGTGANLTTEDGAVTGRRRVLEAPSLDDLIDHNHFIQGSVMMRRDAVESVGLYDEAFSVTEDYDLWLRLANEYPVRNIDEPLYEFRIHGDSTYADPDRLPNFKLLHQFAVLRVQDDAPEGLYTAIQQDGPAVVYDHLSTAQRAAYHTEMAQEYIRYGNLGEGRRHALDALRQQPGPMPLLMLILSFLGARAADWVAQTYRKRVVNPRIATVNANSSTT